jgi:hypothetical protein
VPHKVVDRVVSLVDVFPTILDMALRLDIHNLLPYESDGIALSVSPSCDRAVYSETWQRDNKKLLIPKIFISSFLWQRAVRTENTKCIINGTPKIFSENDAIEHMSNEEFIQNVYRGLLCRFEDYNDYYRLLQDFNEGLRDRATFLKAILNSSEYKSRQPYGIYDLDKDPYEETPLRMDEGKGIQGDVTGHFDMIKLISGNARSTDDIFPGDEKTIADILKNAFGEEWESRAGMMVNNKHLFSCIIDDFIIHMRDKDMVYKRKTFEDEILTSEEFALFLRKRMSAGPPASSVTKKVITRYISRHTIDKMYFLLLKLFPRETWRGRVWQKFLQRMLNS